MVCPSAIQVESCSNIHIKPQFYKAGCSHFLAGLPECAYLVEGDTRHSLRGEILQPHLYVATMDGMIILKEKDLIKQIFFSFCKNMVYKRVMSME